MQMLDDAPALIEGFSFQVVPGDVDRTSVRMALATWARRNFPALDHVPDLEEVLGEP
jgi:hypothetical protein